MADNKFLDQQGLNTLWSRIGEIYARVRRDNESNWNKIKDTFIPENREICFVDIIGKGLRAKVGDGVTVFAQLPYTDDPLYEAISAIVQRGYFYNGKFYSDSSHTEELTASSDTIYIEAERSVLYIYNNNEYVAITDMLPSATEIKPGILKLYSTTGQNTDGTMTQRAITNELQKKIEATVDLPEETLVLSISS